MIPGAQFQSAFESEIPGYLGGAYACPSYEAQDSHKIAWLQRSVGTGMEWLRSQSAGEGYEQTIALMANRISAMMPKKLSKIKLNRLKRDLREIISTLTNLNPRWNYTASPPELQEQVGILNKRLQSWWTTSFIDRALKKALQHGICGAGYISPVWGKSPYNSTDQNDIVPRVFGTFDFILDQIPLDGDYQKAYIGHIRDTMPFNLACSTFSFSARYLTPDRNLRASTAGGMGRLASRWAGTLMGALGIGGFGGLQSTMAPLSAFPELDVYYSYIADDTINQSGRTMHVNELMRGTELRMLDATGTTWDYTIPSLGSPIPIGTFHHDPTDPNADEQGMAPDTRPATMEDAKLYPLRRLIIWTSHCLIYDGPSFWWHGKIPIVKFSLDQGPFEYLGYNVAMELMSVNEAINTLTRGFIDCLELKLDPPTTHHEKEISRKAMESVNLRVPGTKIPKSGFIPDPIASVFPYQHYEPSQQTMPMLQFLQQAMDYQVGVQDLSAVAKLQQVPSAETVDKLLQAAGPLTQDYAREMERSLTELAMLAMWCWLQFDTLKRRLEIIGPDGVTKEDVDYDPARLTPGDVPGVASDAPIMRKGLAHGRRFALSIVPRSVFGVTDVQNKLFMFQLWRDGRFPVDPWTLAKVWNLPNFGDPPHQDMISNWMAWMEMQTKFQTVLQIQAQQLMAQAQLQMMAAMGGAPTAAPQEGESPGAPKDRGGRPPSGNEPPTLETKGDGRSTIAES